MVVGYRLKGNIKIISNIMLLSFGLSDKSNAPGRSSRRFRVSIINIYIYNCWKVQTQVIYTTMVSWTIPIVRQSKTDLIHQKVMRPLRHGGSHCTKWLPPWRKGRITCLFQLTEYIYIYLYIYMRILDGYIRLFGCLFRKIFTSGIMIFFSHNSYHIHCVLFLPQTPFSSVC